MHETTIVPLETWAFLAPDLKAKGLLADIGLVAEALIYYDTVYVIPGYQQCFNQFIRWFYNQKAMDDLLTLLNEGSIKIYDYAFKSTAVNHNGVYSLWNVQGEDQARGNVFEKNYLYNKEFELMLPSKARHRIKYYDAFRGNIIEVKSEAFGACIKNAINDYKDSVRNNITIQVFIDEVYKYKNLGVPPRINTNIKKIDSEKILINWNTDLKHLSSLAGSEVSFNPGSPLTAYAHSNRYLWSAASTGFDLYLANPMSKMVGNKLYEASRHNQNTQRIIETLQVEVDFPNVRDLVNQRIIGLKEVLEIRKKAINFRKWLQSEAERDRNAIIAYHNEVLKKTNFTKYGRKCLNLFGILGGGAIGGAVGSAIAGPIGGAVGGATGSAFTFLTDVTNKLGKDWKPVIFGNWLKEQIEDYIN